MAEHPAHDLSEEKVRLVEKYRLVPKEIEGKLFWVREFQSRPDHPYATHRALRKCDILDLVFYFYDLCVAKMTYFKAHRAEYQPAKMGLHLRALVPCEWWDMEFLVQKGTGISLDLRNLAEISDIEVFRGLCRWLESERDAAAGIEPPSTQHPHDFVSVLPSATWSAAMYHSSPA